GRLQLRRCEPGGPAVPRVEPERSVLQGEPADDPLQVQPGLPVHGDYDEARAVCGDTEVGEGARVTAGRAGDRGGHRLSEQLPLRGAAEHHAELADADAPVG